MVIAAALSIQLNQVGYPPSFPKRATLVNSSAAALTRQLKNKAGKVVASGQTAVYGNRLYAPSGLSNRHKGLPCIRFLKSVRTTGVNAGWM